MSKNVHPRQGWVSETALPLSVAVGDRTGGAEPFWARQKYPDQMR